MQIRSKYNVSNDYPDFSNYSNKCDYLLYLNILHVDLNCTSLQNEKIRLGCLPVVIQERFFQ